MIEEPPLLIINRATRRPSAAQIAAFQGVPTGFVNDAMFGLGALSSAIRPLGEGRDLHCVAAGPALTVDNRPGDLLPLLAALAHIRAGDIVVSTCAGYQGCASAGDRLAGMVRNNGAAALITDGPMRDYAGIVAVGMPCWCTGLTPASPVAKGPGRVGLPIDMAGQRIETGDMVIADRDGVVIVPFARLDEVIAALERVTAAEVDLDAKVAAGLTIPPSITDLLASDVVQYLD